MISLQSPHLAAELDGTGDEDAAKPLTRRRSRGSGADLGIDLAESRSSPSQHGLPAAASIRRVSRPRSISQNRAAETEMMPRRGRPDHAQAL